MGGETAGWRQDNLIDSLGVWGSGGEVEVCIAYFNLVFIFKANGLGDKGPIEICTIGAAFIVDNKNIVNNGQTGVVARYFLVRDDYIVASISPQMYFAVQGK